MDEITRCPNCHILVEPEYIRYDKRTGNAVCCTVCVPNHIKRWFPKC